VNNMNEQNENRETNRREEYAENFSQYDSKDQAIVFILWSIHHKKLGIGSKLFYEPLKKQFNLSKTHWGLVREFLSGANVLVDQVIISDKIPKELQERFAIR
jgi:hypothetical protein